MELLKGRFLKAISNNKEIRDNLRRIWEEKNVVAYGDDSALCICVCIYTHVALLFSVKTM
jgi:hypothetical protein